MKVNRLIALAVLALLTVGAMGLVSSRSFARTLDTHYQQAQATTVAPTQSPALEDPAAGPDTDTIQAQAGEQVADSQPESTEAPGSDTGPDVQTPSYSSSIAVDQNATDGMSEADEGAALAGQAKITVDQAKTAALAANPGTTVVKAELDNENGALVYSVELSNGSDVKVDAGNGVILRTEAGGDNEG